MDLSALSHVSEGFSAGAIEQTVSKVLTARRIEQIDKRPLAEPEFLNALALAASKDEIPAHETRAQFRAWGATITTGERRTRDRTQLPGGRKRAN